VNEVAAGIDQPSVTEIQGREQRRVEDCQQQAGLHEKRRQAFAWRLNRWGMLTISAITTRRALKKDEPRDGQARPVGFR
jgi:hypothetical protein